MSTAFPILKLTEIVQICRELEIPLTTQELKEPSESIVTPVYDKFLACMVGVERKELGQFSYDEVGLPADISEPALSQARFLREVIKMMQAVGMEDFGLADILCPTGERFRRALSAIINFIKYREDYLEHHNALTQESEQLATRIATLTRNRDAAAADLEALRAAKQKEADTLQNLQTEVANLETRLRELKHQHTVHKDRINELRIESNDLATFVNESKARVRQLEEEIAAAKDRIVPSPDRMQAEMHELTRHVENAKLAVAELTRRQRALQTKEQLVADKEHQLEQRVESIRDCIASLDRVMALENENATSVKRNREALAEITDLKAQESQTQAELDAVDSRMFKIQSDFEKKRLAAEEALKSVQQQREQLKEDRKKAKSRGEANEVTYRLRQQELAAMQTEHEEQMAKVRRKFAALEQCLAQYHSQLLNAMRAHDTNGIRGALNLGASALAAMSDELGTSSLTSSLTSTIPKQANRLSSMPR